MDIKAFVKKCYEFGFIKTVSVNAVRDWEAGVLPKSILYDIRDQRVVCIDNTTNDCWMEEFSFYNLNAAFIWLTCEIDAHRAECNMVDDDIYEIIQSGGYHDGYYWTMHAEILLDGVVYHISSDGSGSGYIPISQHCVKGGEFNRLYGGTDDEFDGDEAVISGTIRSILSSFFKSGAKHSWSYFEDGMGCCFEEIDGERFDLSY